MTEKILQTQILKAIGARPDLRVWRQNTGQSWTGNQVVRIAAPGSYPVEPGDVVIRQAHPIRFGLPGSADIFGIMQPSGRFLAIEVKAPKGRVTEEQKRFLGMVRAMGGVAIVARSVEEVIARLANNPSNSDAIPTQFDQPDPASNQDF